MSIDDILKDLNDDIERLRNAPQRPEERIPEILALLQDIWTLKPDLRFWQLLASIKFNATGDPDTDLFQTEDTVTIEYLTNYLKELENR